MPLMRLLRPVVSEGRVIPDGSTMERSEEDAAILEAAGTATRVHRPVPPVRQLPGWGREAKIAHAPEPMPARNSRWSKR